MCSSDLGEYSGVVNFFGDTLTITSEKPGDEFDFITGYFGEVYGNDSSLRFTGLKDDVVVYDEAISVGTATFVELGWADIDKLTIEFLSIDYSTFIFDDLTFAVPA